MASRNRARDARTPAGGRVIDLDSARAARAEAAGEPVVLKMAGRSFRLPAECPFAAVVAIDRADAAGAVLALVGAEGADEFLRWASIEDANEFVTGAMSAYGLDQGE